MLDLVFRPLRAALRAVERDSPLAETEHDVLDAVEAIHRATDSIEHHVEVIESLATSVGPLTDSVDRLTATMGNLVEILAPLSAAERHASQAAHEAERIEEGVGGAEHRVVERLFRFHHKQDAADEKSAQQDDPPPGGPAGSGGSDAT